MKRLDTWRFLKRQNIAALHNGCRDSMRTFLACVLECGRARPLCITTTKKKPFGAACALCHSHFVIPSSLHIRASSLLTGTER
jgi:hypothetical protein